MKTIDTLIEDIHEVINGNHNVPEETVEKFGLALGRIISQNLFQAERPAKEELRMSNLGQPCERKLWYATSDDHDPIPLPPEAKIKFLFGDILEELLFFLAEAAGHRVENRQREVEINGVLGHIDGTIDNVLVDAKSASSRSYDKFARHELGGDDPFGYIDQLNSYHFALRKEAPIDNDQFAFLVIGKELGHICLDRYTPNGVDYDALVDHKRAIIANPKPPKRAYFDEPDGKSGNRKLPTNCAYCNYKHSCWPNVRTFLYSNGPRYLTEVARVPDVPEVFNNDKENELQE